MHYHELFGEMSQWLGLLLGAALVLLLAIVSATIRAAGGEKAKAAGEEHAEPPIPLVLKMLYVLIALWAVGYVLWVALSGSPI